MTMTAEKEESKEYEIKRESVKLKKPLTQNRETKEPGDLIEVTPAQKTRLAQQGII